MPLGNAPGYPQHSGSVVPNAIWSGKLLVKFYEATVLADISNTEYEGDIATMGDKVIIRTTPSITIRDYTKGQQLQSENPEPSTVELDIDKGKYWDFICEDVDKFQSDYDYMNDWTRDASEQLKIAIDTDVLGTMYVDVDAANQGATAGAKSGSFNLGVSGTPIALDKTNVLDFIADMGSVLSEQNVPESDRWGVIPVWMSNLITKSDLKNTDLTGDGTSPLRNNRLGMINNFTLYVSNLLSTTTDGANTVTNMVFGHKSGLTFASQLLENEDLRSENFFGTKVRGLQVYGFKVIKSQSICWGYAYKA